MWRHPFSIYWNFQQSNNKWHDSLGGLAIYFLWFFLYQRGNLYSAAVKLHKMKCVYLQKWDKYFTCRRKTITIWTRRIYVPLVLAMGTQTSQTTKMNVQHWDLVFPLLDTSCLQLSFSSFVFSSLCFLLFIDFYVCFLFSNKCTSKFITASIAVWLIPNFLLIRGWETLKMQ